MEFNKIFNDIFEVYKENINNDLLSLEDMNSINKIFYNYINSYYFKDLYKASFLKETADGYIYPLLLKNSFADKDITINGISSKIKELVENKEYLKLKENIVIFDIQSFLKLSDINILDEVWEVFNYSNNDNLSYFEDFNLNERLIIDNLKIKNKIYSDVFETSDIKKSINIKKKSDLNFYVIDKNNDISILELIKELDNFSKIPTIDIKKLLIENYGIQFLKDTNNIKKCVVAYTENEIAGLLIVNDSYYLKEMGVIDYKKFDYISSISTSLSFRGNKIGIRMVEKLIENSNESDNILIMSQFTNLGSIYLKNDVEKISKSNNNIILINEDEKDKYAYKLIEYLFNNDERLIEKPNTDELIKQKSLNFIESRNLLKNFINKARIINDNNYESLLIESINIVDEKNNNKQKIKVN